MQKENKKPSHSSLSNLIWSIRMLHTYTPAVFILMAFLVPVNILLQYLEIYLPSLVVSEVTNRQTPHHAMVSVGVVLFVMMIGNILPKAMEGIKHTKFEQYRYKLSDLATRKRLGMFYQIYERKGIRDLADRAGLVTSMWDGSQPATDFIQNGFDMVQNLLSYILFGTVISFASPWLVPLLTIAPVVNLLCVHAYSKWEYSHREQLADLDRKLYFAEGLPNDFSAAKDIRIYSMASWLRECYHDLSQERADWDRKIVTKSFLSRLADLLVILIRDGGAYALLISMVLEGEITVENFILYFAAISSFATWVGGIIDCWNKIHADSLKICDFRDYLDYPDQDGTGNAKAAAHLSTAPEIVFDQVCFRYDGAEEDTIHNLSFTLHGGEKLALVGHNGAGKTTIVKLLCGLYTPTSGEIRINGIPLTEFRREDYYRLISPVFQNVRTAFFSLAETISGRSMEETDIKRAEECMRLTGLGDKLDTLPEGISTPLNKQVHKNGTELSGGQAQKLMLARALYKDAPLLVLDEPTSALDPIAESRIYEEYNRMTENKTSLFISHRLASTSFCDRIILLKDGAIAEEGTHEALMKKDGEYKKLFDIQSCWYKENMEGGLKK